MKGNIFDKINRIVKPIYEKIEERLSGVVDNLRNNIRRVFHTADGAIHFLNDNILKKKDSKIMTFIDTIVPGGPVKDEIIDLVSKWIDSGNYQEVSSLLTDVIVGGDPQRALKSVSRMSAIAPPQLRNMVRPSFKQGIEPRYDSDDDDESDEDDDDVFGDGDDYDKPNSFRPITKQFNPSGGFGGFGRPIN